MAAPAVTPPQVVGVALRDPLDSEEETEAPTGRVEHGLPEEPHTQPVRAAQRDASDEDGESQVRVDEDETDALTGGRAPLPKLQLTARREAAKVQTPTGAARVVGKADDEDSPSTGEDSTELLKGGRASSPKFAEETATFGNCVAGRRRMWRAIGLAVVCAIVVMALIWKKVSLDTATKSSNKARGAHRRRHPRPRPRTYPIATPGCLGGAATAKLVYTSSLFEMEWREKVVTFSDESRHWTAGCRIFQQDKALVDEWLHFWEARETGPQSGRWSKDVFSYYSLWNGTNNTGIEIPIEPLVGFLRHPLSRCFSKQDFVASADYMLPVWNSEVYPSLSCRNSACKNLLLDVGAGMYRRNNGAPTQEWFIEMYKKRGIFFDQVYAWESKPGSAADVWKALPSDVAAALHFINLPASPTAKGSANPLRLLEDIASPCDFVVFKLDIDDTAAEEAFVTRILAKRGISRLIDEFYWEHHVHGSPMSRFEWRGTTGKKTLNDSYAIFHQLRTLGVRSHSWV